ncbi:MAG TPA: serine hydrolase domain-containing protein [Thermoanaerobaculia bacterium]
MNRRCFLTSSTLAMTAPLFAAPSKKPPAADLELFREVTRVPAIVVAGLVDGAPLALASGVKDARKSDPVSVDTLFPAASLTKPVFALAVRKLVRAGRLSWDAPLQEITDLGLTGEAARITAAHVLSHATGLPNWRFQPELKLEPGFAPGSRWQYSGEGYVLLQRVVESITAQPIATHLQESILAPFGMASSTLAWTPELEATAAAGHDRNGAPLEKSLGYYAQRNHEILEKAELRAATATYEQIEAAYAKSAAAPLPVMIAPNVAGSMMTTAADYARFLTRLAADMLEHPADYRPRVEVNRALGWTLGLGVDGSAFFQWGDGPGFKHLAWIRPRAKTGVVFLTNGDRGQALYSRVLRRVLGEDPATLYWL